MRITRVLSWLGVGAIVAYAFSRQCKAVTATDAASAEGPAAGVPLPGRLATAVRRHAPSRREVAELESQVTELETTVERLAATPTRAFRLDKRDDRWTITEEGAAEAIDSAPTKKQALIAARALADRCRPSRLTVYRADGTAQDTFHYAELSGPAG